MSQRTEGVAVTLLPIAFVLATGCGARTELLDSDPASSGGSAGGSPSGSSCKDSCRAGTCKPTLLFSEGFRGSVTIGGVAGRSDGGVYVGAEIYGSLDLGDGQLTNPGGGSAMLARFAPDGSPVWAQVFGGTDYEGITAIASDSSDAVVAAGFMSKPIDFGDGPVHGVLFLAKFDEIGNLLWAKGIPGHGASAEATGLAIAANDDIVLAGNGSSIDLGAGALDPGKMSAFVGRYDSGGNLRWGEAFPATSIASTQVAVAPDDSLRLAFEIHSTVVGQTELNEPGAALVALKAGGAPMWARALTASGSLLPGGIACDAAGGAILTGVASGNVDLGDGDTSGSGSFLAKYDADGNAAWSHPFFNHALGGNWGIGVDVDRNGTIYLLAQADHVDFGGGQLPAGHPAVTLASFDGCGNWLWDSEFGPATHFAFGSLGLSRDGTLLLAGQMTGPGSGPLDFGDGAVNENGAGLFVAKFSPQ
jgi:hypothetical protein